ncbi:MAG: RagB/SusD family nutrient uptake outer membrane protein [Deltaproteobacteria bacterium]|nr:RagB/SusD family nutrient uptake outer membrane protein [Deltaproteobacteria bacterium]
MKNIYKIISIIIMFLAIIISQGCESDVLNTQPTDSVSKQDVFASADAARGVLYAVYRDWRASANTFAGLTFPILLSDAMGPDFCKIASYEQAIAYSDQDQGSGTVRYPWQLLYRNINNLNDLLANVDDIPDDQEAIDQVKGEALAMRGYSYFELVRRYMHTYAIASSMPGVPLYTEPTTGETLGNPRSSVSDVYTQILSDLNQAASLMTTDRQHEGYFNVDVVYAILAKVYLTMEDWANAITYAQSAKENYPLMSVEEWQSGFIEINSEWIWAQNNNELENPGIGCAANVMAPFTSGQWAWASDTLAESYSATDIRGELFEQQPDGRYFNFKFQQADPVLSSDYPYIRSAEMYLIEAEALAKSGNEPDAQDALYAVQLRADPNAVKSTATGQDLIDEILLEKRKEFWGEGVVFFDMLRNQKPLVRDANHQTPLNFPANSWEFILPIPEREFLINKNLDITTDQNPVTGVFTGNEFN